MFSPKCKHEAIIMGFKPQFYRGQVNRVCINEGRCGGVPSNLVIRMDHKDTFIL